MPAIPRSYQRCPGQGFNQRGSEYRRRSEGIWGAPLNKEERYLDSEDLDDVITSYNKLGEYFRHRHPSQASDFGGLGWDALPGQRCPGQGFNQRGSEYRRRSEGISGAPLNKEERYLDSEDLLKKFGETFRHMSDISLLKQQSFHDEMMARYESIYKSAAQYELLIDVLGRDNKRLREELDAAVKNQKLAADSQDDADHPPHYFVCPITGLVMENPSLAADGYTYEDSAIRRWLMEHGTSPITRERLAHYELIPNRALRSAIEDWERKQGQSSQAGPSRNRERCVNGGP